MLPQAFKHNCEKCKEATDQLLLIMSKEGTKIRMCSKCIRGYYTLEEALDAAKKADSPPCALDFMKEVVYKQK